MTPDDWRAAWERERDARLDAEARLAGLRWAVAAVVVAAAALAVVVEGLSASSDVSRAVARWEVSDGE